MSRVASLPPAKVCHRQDLDNEPRSDSSGSPSKKQKARFSTSTTIYKDKK